MSPISNNRSAPDSYSRTSSAQAARTTPLRRKRHLDSTNDLDQDDINEEFDSSSLNGGDIDSNTLESDVDDFHDSKGYMVAIEALGKLKNSSTSSIASSNANSSLSPPPPLTATSTNDSPNDNGVGVSLPIHGAGPDQRVMANGEINTQSIHRNSQFFNQQRFFNTVSNYYKSSKDFSPTFKVGAEFVEKRAIPIVRKFEQRFPNSSISNIRNSIARPNAAHGVASPSANGSVRGNGSFLNNRQRSSFGYLQAQQQKLQNFNLSVSIESKKNLRVLLKILKLANSRLSAGVDNLQHLITEKEQKLINKAQHPDCDDQDDDDDIENDYDIDGEVAESKRLAANAKRQKITKKSNKQKHKDGLNQVKKDIVVTVKKAVTVISKFTGNSLPEPARTSVRDVLLKLPENLSKALNTNIEEFQTPISSVPGSPKLGPSTLNTTNNDNGPFPSSPQTPTTSLTAAAIAASLSLENAISSGANPNHPSTPGSPLSVTSNTSINTNFLRFHKIDPNFTNRKILILAKESLDSFANIIKIFDANLNKMDDWVEIEKQKEISRLRKFKTASDAARDINVKNSIVNGNPSANDTITAGSAAANSNVQELQNRAVEVTESVPPPAYQKAVTDTEKSIYDRSDA